jgi:hypothetical protein
MVSGNNFQKKKTLLLLINDFDSDFLEKEIAPKKTYFPLVPIYNIVLQWWPSWISDPKLKNHSFVKIIHAQTEYNRV